MVLSDTKKLLFLRVCKNASTSLAAWFVTNACNRNNPRDKWTAIPDFRMPDQNVPQSFLQKYSYHFQCHHMTLQGLIDEKIVTEKQLEDMDIIGVIRNPFDRQISLFKWLYRNVGDVGPGTVEEAGDVTAFRYRFREGKHHLDINNEVVQADYFKLNGEIHPNCKIWLWEDIRSQQEKLMKEKNIVERYPLLRSKVSNRTRDRQEFERYYDDKTMRAVREYFDEDFKLIQKLKLTK